MRVTFHPGFARALVLGVVLVVAALLLSSVGRTGRSEAPPLVQQQDLEAVNEFLLPVIWVCPSSDDEASWSDALEQRIGGVREAAVEGGRADLLVGSFAVEVDRLEKWHEGVGQALHYGSVTGKQPALALILGSDAGRPNETLRLVDRVCVEQGIRLVLLQRRC